MQSNGWTPSLTNKDREWVAGVACRPAPLFVPDTPGAAPAYVSAALARALPGPVVLVTEGPHAMDALLRDVHSMSPVEALGYPPWESLPGKEADLSPDTFGDRLEVLRQCGSTEPPRLLVTCVQALMQRTLAPDDLAAKQLNLQQGADYNLDALLESLDDLGFAFEAEVITRGQAARRGGIIDCWPPASPWPVRCEFFGDTLESIRTFDPEDQRSIERIASVTLLPVRERTITADASSHRATLLDYLPETTHWVWHDAGRIREHALHYEQIIADADIEDWTWSYRALRAAIKKRFLQAPIYLEGDATRDATHWNWTIRPLDALPSREQFRADPGALEAARHDYIDALQQKAEDGEQVRIYFGTEGTRDRFVEWRKSRRDPSKHFTLLVGPLSAGFHDLANHCIVVSEQDLYGKRRDNRAPAGRRRRRATQAPTGPRLADWRDIQPGELVVHIDHGIGRYLGLYEIDSQGQGQEVLTIEYADKAKIFLPVAQAHLLSRYIGFGKQRPELHALGGKRWTREKVAAERAVRDLAASLLETQARRETMPGHAFAKDAHWQHEFEQAFPFEETEDQWRAIRDVKSDMESARPMDRLICGDVGYGKTEVAMRAAFKAVMDGRQVALLVPTTILAQQHYETFRERMSAFPIRIEMLSRFRTRKEQQTIVEELNQGRIDIVVGTHRLVQPDVQFKNLGLVIVDEEQRFGVEHKEHLKAMRQLVDVLTMTATPIPRTLYLSLAGARDISTIQTPPQERLPVETIISEYRDDVVRDAIRRELSREGQVFYLHNRVRTIEKTREKLQALVPDARIAIGHGQMHERELETVMSAFVRGEYDVLLCTTIIESGVDIPNVNTIFIERADRFGLSDLYQLRGRVGRYKHQAYAYLLLPRHGQLFSAARERVRAIRQYSGLGSGFKLAMRDLEIRGAGNILGAEQSGHIAAVGFDLYCQFLKRTVAKLKGETPPPIIDVEVRLDFIDTTPAHADDPAAAVIPVTYLEDENLRVNAYRRIAGLATEPEVRAFREELTDRHGPPPDAVERLLQIAALRIAATERGITEIEVKDSKVMMKRGADWCMIDKKFPRLTASQASERLTELQRVINTF